MTNYDHDTDPSTPGAKRPADQKASGADSIAAADIGSAARNEAGTRAVSSRPPPPGPGQRRDSPRGRPTTDPGIAPPPPPLPVIDPPTDLVVPSFRAEYGSRSTDETAPNTFDSVDVLLEGIAREQPERARTSGAIETPSAPARWGDPGGPHGTPPYGEPKVIIDRRALEQPTGRGPVARSSPRIDPKVWNVSTAPSGRPLAPRVLIAVLAALGVVLLIFVALKRTSPGPVLEVAAGPASARPIASVPVVPAESPSAGVPEHPAPVASESPEAPPAPSALASATIAGARKAAAPAKPGVKPKTRSAPAARPPGADLGEFKGSL